MDYCIYKIKLFELPAVEGDWTREEPIDSLNEKTALGKFESLFGNKGTHLQILKMKKNLIDKDFPNIILAHTKNVILLQLNNVQIKKLWKPVGDNRNTSNYEQTKEESNPYCNVIFDCREGCGLMAVEVDHTAWSKTDTVRDLLQENIGRMLNEKYGIGLEIATQMKPSDFWDYVDFRKKKENKYIRRLTWTFKNAKKMPGADTVVKMSPHLNALNAMLEQFWAESGELSLENPVKDPLSLNRRWVDMKNMIKYSAMSYYSMSVTFNDGVTYKCNDTVQAILPIVDKYVKDFGDGQTESFFEFSLFHRLDEINNMIKDYSDAEQIKPKTNRNHKKRVS